MPKKSQPAFVATTFALDNGDAAVVLPDSLVAKLGIEVGTIVSLERLGRGAFLTVKEPDA